MNLSQTHLTLAAGDEAVEEEDAALATLFLL
jgi:hypothetical protein